MHTDTIALIDKKIEALINDKTKYNLNTLKVRVEDILKGVDIFTIENKIDSKAIDLYLKKVITKRNNIKKEQEKNKLIHTKEERYALIEAICKKLEFENQEELVKKIEKLEKKTNFELSEINNSL